MHVSQDIANGIVEVGIPRVLLENVLFLAFIVYFSCISLMSISNALIESPLTRRRVAFLMGGIMVTAIMMGAYSLLGTPPKTVTIPFVARPQLPPLRSGLTTISAAGLNSPTENTKVMVETRRAWEELKDGVLLYETNKHLREGEAATYTIQIVPNSGVIVPNAFANSMNVERIKISSVMDASLKPLQVDEVDVKKNSSEKQAVLGESTDWDWTIMPKVSGDLQLKLTLTAYLILANGNEIPKDLSVSAVWGKVDANPRWRLLNFIALHWEFVVSFPPLMLILTWAFNRYVGKNAPSSKELPAEEQTIQASSRSHKQKAK